MRIRGGEIAGILDVLTSHPAFFLVKREKACAAMTDHASSLPCKCLEDARAGDVTSGIVLYRCRNRDSLYDALCCFSQALVFAGSGKV
jgi:hypothetical protein